MGPTARSHASRAVPTSASACHASQGIPPTIFSEMSALAVRTGAVNLGQGFPDVDGPPSVIAAAVRGAARAAPTSTRPASAYPRCAQAIARHQQRHYGLELDPDREVVVTTGCTEGDRRRAARAGGPGRRGGGARAVLRLLRRDDPDGRRRTPPGDAAGARTSGSTSTSCGPRSPPRTRLMLLNSPHNPTGTVLTRDELQAVADVAIEHDLVVVTDEVYEHLVFDDAPTSTSRWRPCRGCGSAR